MEFLSKCAWFRHSGSGAKNPLTHTGKFNFPDDPTLICMEWMLDHGFLWSHLQQCTCSSKGKCCHCYQHIFWLAIHHVRPRVVFQSSTQKQRFFVVSKVVFGKVSGLKQGSLGKMVQPNGRGLTVQIVRSQKDTIFFKCYQVINQWLKQWLRLAVYHFWEASHERWKCLGDMPRRVKPVINILRL